MIASSIAVSQETQAKDYYTEGQVAAKKDFSSVGAMTGGFFSSCFYPPLGYMIGVLIVLKKKIDVPSHYLSKLDVQQIQSFEIGYKDYVKKTTLEYYLIVGGISTVLWWKAWEFLKLANSQ